MKKVISLLICLILTFSFAAAEQTVTLPGTGYAVDLPDGLRYSAPEIADEGVHAWVSDTLEMDCQVYPREKVAAFGETGSLRESAEKLAEKGAEVELRDVNGIEMLVYRLKDSADGAPGIGYVFEYGDMIVEVIFWYATQEAADETKTIMESIRNTDSPT